MYSLNKYLPVSNYRQHNIKYEGKKDTVHLQGASNQEKQTKDLQFICGGAEELVFWSQAACVQLLVLLLINALSLNFLSREAGTDELFLKLYDLTFTVK